MYNSTSPVGVAFIIIIIISITTTFRLLLFITQPSLLLLLRVSVYWYRCGKKENYYNRPVLWSVIPVVVELIIVNININIIIRVIIQAIILKESIDVLLTLIGILSECAVVSE